MGRPPKAEREFLYLYEYDNKNNTIEVRKHRVTRKTDDTIRFRNAANGRAGTIRKCMLDKLAGGFRAFGKQSSLYVEHER